MSLTEKHGSHLSLFSFGGNKSPVAASAFKPFEEILIGRLRSLLPIPDCSRSVPLRWLSHAVHLLSITLADAVSIISDPSLSAADLPAISSYLNSNVALLDVCNVISAAADRILRRRLHVLLALRLIVSSSPDRRLRASSAIAEWKDLSSPPQLLCCSADLLRRLRSVDPNRGRLTAARRAIYAVEAFSDLVARSSLAVLGKKGDDAVLLGIRASEDFPWAAAYSEVVAAVSAKLLRGERAGVVAEAEASVSKLAAVVDKDEGDVGTEELQNAVRGAEWAMEELTEGMCRLTDAVNGLFDAGLKTSNAAVQCFRAGQGKCK